MSRYVKCDRCQNTFLEMENHVMQVTLKAERINPAEGDEPIIEETTRDLCRPCMLPIVVQFKEIMPLDAEEDNS